MTDQIPNKQYKEFDQQIPKDLQGGPRKDRGCTDLSCCFIFTLFIVLTGVIAFLGMSTGNPAILAQPFDMDSQPCGVQENADYPLIYFPSPKSLKKNVCVKSCPNTNSTSVDCLKNTICPDGTLSQDVQKSQLIYDSIPVANRVCIPINQEYYKQIKTVLNVEGAQQIASDLRNTWMICSSSILSSIILGYIFMYLVNILAGSLVWSFVIMIFSALTSLGLLFLFQYIKLTNPPTLDKTITDNSAYKLAEDAMSNFKDKDEVLVAAIVLLSLALIFIVAICCLCERIRLAISVLKASARFMTENPRVTLIPILSFIISTAFFVAWFIIAIYLYSSGGVSKQTGLYPFGHVQVTWDIKTFGWIHLFGLFWYESFFAACQQMVIIGAVAFWYFKVEEIDDSNTTMGAKLFFKNHLGTAAFGSFILGVLSFIKFLLKLISDSAENMKKNNEGNQLTEFVYKALYCFVVVFEKFFKHLNQSAYVWTMMDGKGFCESASKAFSILAANPIRMALVAGIGELFEFLGCAAISGVITLGSYFAITRTDYYVARVENPLVPCLVIAITSYYVGSFIMSLFGTVSEALITMFCIEEGMMIAIPQRKCPQELKDFMDGVENR
ncbi:hypothetical protein ABPG74_009068 [Tetrahymena malaccensis]